MLSPVFSIRRAHPEESHILTLLARMSKAYWKYPATSLEEWKPQLSVTPDQIREGLVWLAERGQTVLGYYRISVAGQRCELTDLFVSPDAMGQGIGRSLLQHSMRAARDLGQSEIAVDADPNAEKFYLAMGAIKVSDIAAPIEGEPARVRPQLLLSIDKLDWPK